MTGVLTVEDYSQDGTFSEATLRVLSPIAAQVAVSIENARLYSELEQRLSETTTLQEVSRMVNSALNVQETGTGVFLCLLRNTLRLNWTKPRRVQAK